MLFHEANQGAIQGMGQTGRQRALSCANRQTPQGNSAQGSGSPRGKAQWPLTSSVGRIIISQCAEILAHLQAGNTLTPLEAYEKFNCLALHSRIAELRDIFKDQIQCEMITVPSGKRVGRYRWKGQLELVA